MAEPKSRKVVAVAMPEAVVIKGTSRTHASLDVEWAKQPGLSLELEHAGGMAAYIRWSQRDGEKGVFRHEVLAHCSAITFEPKPA